MNLQRHSENIMFSATNGIVPRILDITARNCMPKVLYRPTERYILAYEIKVFDDLEILKRFICC